MIEKLFSSHYIIHLLLSMNRLTWFALSTGEMVPSCQENVIIGFSSISTCVTNTTRSPSCCENGVPDIFMGCLDIGTPLGPTLVNLGIM